MPTKDHARRKVQARDLGALLSQRVIGQKAAVDYVVPYVEMFNAGLAPEGRPVGVFLLLGPTGTGKTRTVEALAEVLHGSPKALIKIDCGEFQLDHEVAKLIGAPPGYLGHRETQPILTGQKLASVASEECGLSLVLFDEIEKAAPSLTRLLLGILDRATLNLGDNSTVNFEKALIFLTSNLGARQMMQEIQPDFGFQAGAARAPGEIERKLEKIGLAAVRRKFPPEFVNRIDVVVTYQPLDEGALGAILGQQIEELQHHVNTRLGARSFEIQLAGESRRFLLEKGTRAEYGARELKRTLHRHLVQPLATMVASGQLSPGACARVDVSEDSERLLIRAVAGRKVDVPSHPLILIVDDNRDLLSFLETVTTEENWTLVTAQSAKQARALCRQRAPHVAVLDYLLPDGNGVGLGADLIKQVEGLQVIIMTGAQLPAADQTIRQRFNFPMLPKPFLAEELTAMIRSRLYRSSAATA